MMFSFNKACAAALFTAVSIFTLIANEPITVQKEANYSAITHDSFMMITGPAKSAYAISSLQQKGQIYLNHFCISCQTSDGKLETESKTPANRVKEIQLDVNKGVWKVQYDWDNIIVIRTIEFGNYPGLKVTYDYEVKKDFKSKRIYCSFGMPQNAYNLTGYMNNSVMQFRAVQKGEWFGINRNTDFPYITFSGKDTYGVMILAGSWKSWNELPGMLLYASTDQYYYTAEFMYQQSKELKKGDKGCYSFYIMPVDARNAALNAAELYARLKNDIK